MPKLKVGTFLGRPPSVHSGATLAEKVVIQHHTDVLLQQQTEIVSSLQSDLERGVRDLGHATSSEESKFYEEHVNKLQLKYDAAGIILEVCVKLNAELCYARSVLKRAIECAQSNVDINVARKRIGWLEQRIKNILKVGNLEDETSNQTTGDRDSIRDFDDDLVYLEIPVSRPNDTQTRNNPSRTDIAEVTDVGKDPAAEEGMRESTEVPAKSDSRGQSSSESSPQPLCLRESSSGSSLMRSRSVSPAFITEVSDVAPLTRRLKLPTQATYHDNTENYFNSQHHRFAFSNLQDVNTVSYHRMALSIQGTFVDDIKMDPVLPWRPRSKSSVSDINMRDLNTLSVRVNKMFDKVKVAALVSVDFGLEDDVKPPTNQTSRPLTSELNTQQVGENARANQNSAIVLPPLDSMKPVPNSPRHIILPIARTNRKKDYPRAPSEFCKSVPSHDAPANRLVNQHNLLCETKLTSSLFVSKRVKRKQMLSVEMRLRRLLDEDAHRITEQSANAETLQEVCNAVEASFLDPNSDNLQLLKWERLKEIAVTRLVSEHVDERVDAARHLAKLRCDHPLIIQALRNRLADDDDETVLYEVTKTLILLGCWGEDVLEGVIHFLLEGSHSTKGDIISTMIASQDMSSIDKKLGVFSDVCRILSLLCRNDDAADKVAFKAAVCLQRLEVIDDRAQLKLKAFLLASNDFRSKAMVLHSLMVQMKEFDLDLVNAALEQLENSPCGSQRRDAATCLVQIGLRYGSTSDITDRLYVTITKCLWNDVDKRVRLEAAKALTAFGFVTKACSYFEKQLYDASDTIRSNAVISMGTLGIQSGRVFKILLDMVHLDPSNNVRLSVVRTFASLKSKDERVVRSLVEKSRLGGQIAKEAMRALEAIGHGTSVTRKPSP